LNEATGDFGGAPFPFREQFNTYIQQDLLTGDVTEYGFTIPKLSKLEFSTIPDFTAPPRGAALDFDLSGLPHPEQMPFTFVGLNYNPFGHPPFEFWGAPHWDIHLWFYDAEYSRGIECEGADFPETPCIVTSGAPYLVNRFNKTADASYFPPTYGNNPNEWVPTMGAHIAPAAIDDQFEERPAILYGSYNGRLIFHEPMIANTILLRSETDGPQTFDWPRTAYPKPGRYFTKLSVEYDLTLEQYRIRFHDLIVEPVRVSGGSVPVFEGNLYVPDAEEFDNAVSPTKNCLVASSGALDAGYVIETEASTYCCRARGDYMAGSCLRQTCTGSAALTSPASAFFFSSSSSYCYARCYDLGGQ
jgi:hypothetical protein